MKSILCAVVALTFASSVVADTINVPAGGDIQAAIDGASDGDIIQLEAGEYFPAATIDTIGKAVTLRGVAGKGKDGAPTSVIDGQDSIRVLQCSSGEGADTVFENLLITGGYTSGNGGGMYNRNYESSPTLIDCAFEGNSATNGGGMYNYFYSSPTLENCTFEGNSADFGGGMYNRDNSSPTLTGCTFENNSAEDYGGGMYNEYSSSPSLVNCTITNNSATEDGGGMYNFENSSPTLTGCTFENNSAEDYGGGMYNEYSSSPSLVNCTITNNSATEDGGGMYNFENSSPTLTGTTLCDNLPNQIYGDWTNGGGSCVSFSCADNDGNGVPDSCEGKSGSILLVPSEYPTIELAIAVAKYGDVIEIAAGTYQPAVTLNTQGKLIALRGAIDGEGNPTTIIDGQDSIRVLQCSSGEGAGTVFENLLITGGYTSSSGGGMYNFNSSPTLTNCTFEGNSAGSRGGGMYNYGSSSSPTLTGCTFENNSAEDGGGGIYNYGIGTTMADTILCGNSPDQVFGGWTDNGGNCLSSTCVDDDGDGVPDQCGGKGGGVLLVPSVYPTIESAIAAAAYGDVIEIAAGTYQPAGTLNTQGMPITLRGAIDEEGLPTTIIDGQGSIRVLQCTSGEGEDTIFENVVISGGLAVGDPRYSGGGGGGMVNFGSSPTLMNCTFIENTAAGDGWGYGGGMYNWGSSSPVIVNCTFSGNTATGTYSWGGGVCCDDSSSPVLIGCSFENNSAGLVGGVGGGIAMIYSSNPLLEDCVFRHNSAGSGGGIIVFRSSPTLENCTFTNNSADNRGGGMYNRDESSPTLTDCTFAGNTAIRGGGISTREDCSLILSGCMFEENAANFGGALSNKGCFSCEGTILATGCAFIGNVATTHGGALYGEEYASVSLVECQFASNSDSESYALYNLSFAIATLTDCAFDRCCAVFPITSAIDMGGNHTLYVCDGCEGDVNCDGKVDAADLGRMLAAWGPSTGRYDLNADGEVSGADLGFLFSTWGACP